MKRPGGFDRRDEPRKRYMAQESHTPKRTRPAKATHADAHAAPSALPSPNVDIRETVSDISHSSSSPDIPPLSKSDVQTTSKPDDLAETVPLDRLPQSQARGQQGPRVSLTRATSLLKRRGRSAPADPVKAAERRVRVAERQYKRSNRRETRRFTLEIRRARRRTLIVLAAVVALAVFVLAGAYTPLMAVREVQVEGASQVNIDDVTSALNRLDGVPLALVDENEVLRALENFPLIQRFAVERVPPHTLRVRIEERVPVIALETDGKFQHYDAAGVLLGESEERPEGVPLGSGAIRNSTSQPFRAASQIVRDMTPELQAQLVSVTSATGQDVTFILTNGIEVFWGSADDTVRKSVILQTMLASLEEREVSHIDVSSTSAPIFK